MTRNKQHIGSHSRHSSPDEKMSAPNPRRPEGWKLSSAGSAVRKRLAARKRRQRDRIVTSEDLLQVCDAHAAEIADLRDQLEWCQDGQEGDVLRQRLNDLTRTRR